MLSGRLLLLLFAAFPAVVFAQIDNHSSAMPGMDHSAPTKMIDGSVHPELIPDSTAYRMFFIAAGELPNATTERQNRQTVFFNHFGFQKSDHDAIIKVLQAFKLRYGLLLDHFNAVESARERIGASPQTSQFVAQRDALVQETRDELRQTLSAAGMAHFDAIIKNEKRKMRTTAGGGQ